ncbi:MAG: tyrosine-type recombinase/integrase [Candidatus Bathyarchaeota archaeon]|nr:tyrosine-type recombinase/integrase [Candidatus Bathyarchaeota archaeon]
MVESVSVVKCPECGSVKLFRDGMRYLANGDTVQRWLCRECGYRFSEISKDARGESLNTVFSENSNRQVCALREAKNLDTATETKTVAGEEKTQQDADTKGKIVQFIVQLTNDGKREKSCQTYFRILRLLSRYGADLSNPESVKETIAKQQKWSENTKALAVAIYGKFAEFNRLSWRPPSYRLDEKVPFVPLESELDALIACCGKKLSVILRLLKETGMRVGEALRLKWIDLDTKTQSIMLNDTEKHGKCRAMKISGELCAMLNSMAKNSERIFGNVLLTSWESNFSVQRKRAAKKLQNPRLMQIHFHTFRHWKATMEYAKTKDILYVKQVLGHRNLQNTLRYTQLVTFESNEYHSAVAKTVEEACQLVESGFEYVCDIDNVKLFRKRK